VCVCVCVCVCVSHRPVDVHNVYNQIQVKMLMKEDDCENIPTFEDVFRDDEDEDEEEVSAVVVSAAVCKLWTHCGFCCFLTMYLFFVDLYFDQ